MTSRKIPESAVENLVSDLEGKANRGLDNLTTAGQAKFDAKADVSELSAKANVSLNNLDATGQAKFDAKADVSELSAKANVSLNNLSAAGQAILNGKANTNASNFTATGKQTIVSWGMPDYSAGVAKGWANFIADSNGWIYVSTGANENQNWVTVNGAEVYRCGNNNYTDFNGAIAPVKKGDSIVVNGATYGHAFINFYPCRS